MKKNFCEYIERELTLSESLEKLNKAAKGNNSGVSLPKSKSAKDMSNKVDKKIADINNKYNDHNSELQFDRDFYRICKNFLS